MPTSQPSCRGVGVAELVLCFGWLSCSPQSPDRWVPVVVSVRQGGLAGQPCFSCFPIACQQTCCRWLPISSGRSALPITPSCSLSLLGQGWQVRAFESGPAASPRAGGDVITAACPGTSTEYGDVIGSRAASLALGSSSPGIMCWYIFLRL